MQEIPDDIARRLRETAERIGTSFDDMTMEAIVEATGIPRATLYYHFRSREQVLAFLLAATLSDISEAVEQAASSSAPVPDRLVGVVQAQLQTMAANPATTQLLVANLGRAGKLPDIAAGIDRAFRIPLQQLLVDGAADGSLKAVDPELTATAIFGAVTVVGLNAIMREGHLDVATVLDGLVVLWGGIEPTA
jgi:AcrR family transcriptional regulator